MDNKNMSRATKRKHNLRELFEDDFSLPTEAQKIVQVRRCEGSNLVLVQAEDGEKYLVSMPIKFRRNIWVKRGQYVLVDPVKEGNKVKGEIVRVLTQRHIKEYADHNVWPTAFQEATEYSNAYEDLEQEVDNECSNSDSKDSSDSDTDEDLVGNPNRRVVTYPRDEETDDKYGCGDEEDEVDEDDDDSGDESSEYESDDEGDSSDYESGEDEEDSSEYESGETSMSGYRSSEESNSEYESSEEHISGFDSEKDGTECVDKKELGVKGCLGADDNVVNKAGHVVKTG